MCRTSSRRRSGLAQLLALDVFLTRLLAKCTPTLCNKCSLCVTRDHQLWLVNATDEVLTLNHGELFGFGLGDASETPTGNPYEIN